MSAVSFAESLGDTVDTVWGTLAGWSHGSMVLTFRRASVPQGGIGLSGNTHKKFPPGEISDWWI